MVRAGQRNLLLTFQLILLLLQVLCPVLYYHATTGIAPNALLDIVAAVPPPSQKNLLTSTTNASNSDASPPIESRGGSVSDVSGVVGTFNGVEVTYVDQFKPGIAPLHSTAHCVGETFQKLSWVHRSCEYRNLCFDMEEREFVLFRSPVEAALQQSLDAHNHWQNSLLTVSSALNTTVALGGINMQWTWKPGNAPAMEWAPKVINEALTDGYYELAGDKVFLPFHSMAAVNVGHLLWDDFLPIFSLLSMFDLTQDDLVLVRYVLKNRERALWATCDLRDATLVTCKSFFKKFLPLLGVEPKTMRSTNDSILDVVGPRKSKYVCSSKAVAGLGMLTDHGLKTHGWWDKDYDYSHNAGRGPVLYEFRNFMMRNIGLDPTPAVRSDIPHKITFGISSSKDLDRKIQFHKQLPALKAAFESDANIKIDVVNFAILSAADQVRIASQSSIIVGACGGGAVTHMFLPKGAGLILFYPDKPSGRQHNYPARLDWDYFNNVGYIRVHWLPISTMDTENDLDIFVKLVRNELETISHH